MPVFLRALCPLRNPSVKHVLEIFMKGLSIHSKQRGFTLIEVGIALAIGLVIIMGVARSIQVNQLKLQTAKAVQDVQAILVAAVDFRSGRNDYTGVKIGGMMLGKDIKGGNGNGTGANPWGGNYTVAVNGNFVDIGLTNIPNDVGPLLVAKLNPDSQGGNTALFTAGAAGALGSFAVTYE